MHVGGVEAIERERVLVGDSRVNLIATKVIHLRLVPFDVLTSLDHFYRSYKMMIMKYTYCHGCMVDGFDEKWHEHQIEIA